MYKSVIELLANKKVAERGDNYSIYFLIQDDEIVYVGQTVEIHNRSAFHKREGKVFNFISVIDCSPNEVDLLELFYIHTLRPKYNKTDNGGSFMSSPVSHINIYNLLFPEKKCFKKNGKTIKDY